MKRGTCRCGEPVLLVKVNGRALALDADEVIPPMPCPLCRIIESRGQSRGTWCWRCGGTGMVGDPLPQPGVAIDPAGRARVFAGERSVGEAVHRLHLHR